MNKKIKIALAQYSPFWEDKKQNFVKIRNLCENSTNVDLFILPEMSLTGFTMKTKNLAEDFSGETFNSFSALSKAMNSSFFYGFIEKGKNKIFNTLVHINNQGKLIAKYRKIHPFSYAGEDKYFGKGKNPVISKIKGIKFGLSICYDLRFPELYRLYAKEKVDCIVDIANWPEARIEHWRTLLKARAIENQCYVIGVNRVGDDPKLHYNGFSSVIDPLGNEVVSIENEEKIIQVEIDKSFIDEIRKRLPFLNDMRLV